MIGEFLGKRTNRMGRLSFILLLSSALSSCGTYVPQLHEPWEQMDIDDNLALRIQASIYCELRMAVAELGPQRVIVRDVEQDRIPDNWGAQTTLQLQIDETGSLNPSGSWTPHPVFSLPISAQLSSQATRIDKYYSFFSLKDMKKKMFPGDGSCTNAMTGMGPLDRHGTNLLLSGDLGIRTWLKNALEVRNLGGGSLLPKSQSTKLDVLSYDIKFIIITTGSTNPSVKELRFLTGNGSSLLSGNRTRTNDFLLTIGPAVDERSGNNKTTSPIPAASNLHVTGELQQAFSSVVVSGGSLGQPFAFRLFQQ